MTIVSVLPAIAVALFVLFSLSVAVDNGPVVKQVWRLPAALSVLFFLFSVDAIANEGLLGFWTEHTRNLWGNQIWLDLLLAISIAWCLAVPQMKALGMRPLPWFAAILCSGCVGFLALIARMLYLQANTVTRDKMYRPG